MQSYGKAFFSCWTIWTNAWTNVKNTLFPCFYFWICIIFRVNRCNFWEINVIFTILKTDWKWYRLKISKKNFKGIYQVCSSGNDRRTAFFTEKFLISEGMFVHLLMTTGWVLLIWFATVKLHIFRDIRRCPEVFMVSF